jgi:hypothetical protein
MRLERGLFDGKRGAALRLCRRGCWLQHRQRGQPQGDQQDKADQTHLPH